jgi:hypothetical protein
VVEQRQLTGGPQIVPAADHSPTPAAASEELPVARKAIPKAASLPVISEPKPVVSDSTVTASPQNQSGNGVSDSGKSRGPNLSLMGRMDMSIMK